MKCPVCSSGELTPFFEAAEVPVFCNVLHDTRDAAVTADRGDIELGFCAECGMIYNIAFDIERVRYAVGYENSLHGSPRFQAYAEALADRLIETFSLRNSEVLEIGGGRGEFMELLCDGGGNKGVLFDPSAPPDESDDVERSFEIVREYFNDESTDVEARLIACRHVLEHVPEPSEFVSMIARAGKRCPDAGLYLEVPNGLWTLRDLGIWDIIYEHCSYFSPVTLRVLTESQGLKGMDVREEFGGQFLAAEGTFNGTESGAATAADELTEMKALVAAFSTRYRERVDHWAAHIDAAAQAGRKLAVWGAGSKGVTFLNTVGKSAAVRCVVDINELKEGKFVPGTGQEVVLPTALKAMGIDEVIVMNPIYVDEIAASLEELGVSATVIAV